ncbi:MAG: plasmid stabilization protein [Idiomarinaceae bacterium]|nr:plasmid stabilization protein [Idiomarinaceae bacterium]
MKVVWSPLALKKAADIAEFISQDNPKAAQQWVDELFKKVRLISAFPDMGRIVPELNSARYRELLFGHYRIIYLYSDHISILTIRNCRQLFSESDL